MKRLLFEKNTDGSVYTCKEMLARNIVVNANILVKDDGYMYMITNLGNGVVLLNGTTKRLTDAKRLVKERLKDLGVVFQDEVRKKVVV